MDPILREVRQNSFNSSSVFSYSSWSSNFMIDYFPSGIVSFPLVTTLEYPYVYVKNNPVNLKDPKGLSSQYGEFEVEMDPNGTHHHDVTRGYTGVFITFVLSKSACCKEVKFVQIVKTSVSRWHVDTSDENLKRGIYWYGGGEDESYQVYQYRAALLKDKPGCDICPILTQRFETCAICTKGKDAKLEGNKKRNYGCITWGHFIRWGRVRKIWVGKNYYDSYIHLKGIKLSPPTAIFNQLTKNTFEYKP